MDPPTIVFILACAGVLSLIIRRSSARRPKPGPDFILGSAMLTVVLVTAMAILLTACNAAIPLPATPTARASPIAARTSTAELMKPMATETPTACTVKTGVPAGSLNLRSGAGMQYKVIRVLREGERLTVLSAGAWLKVTDEHGARGYINARYCQ